MKKILFTIFCFVITICSIQAQESSLTANQEKSSSQLILPRYFNDKFIVNHTNSSSNNTYRLHIYSIDGKNVCSQEITLNNEEFIFYTNKLKTGNYIYFIVENNKPIIKGEFTKS